MSPTMHDRPLVICTNYSSSFVQVLWKNIFEVFRHSYCGEYEVHVRTQVQNKIINLNANGIFESSVDFMNY